MTIKAACILQVSLTEKTKTSINNKNRSTCDQNVENVSFRTEQLNQEINYTLSSPQG